jgi:hypothetical protein
MKAIKYHLKMNGNNIIHGNSKSYGEFLHILGLFFTIYFVGIMVFHLIEGWNYLDSAYFVTTTVLTIGYGDITPKTEIGKLATIIFGWIGVSTGFYLLLKISDWRRRNFDAYITELHEFVGAQKKR